MAAAPCSSRAKKTLVCYCPIVPRRTLLDDLVTKRICDALREGHTYKSAARAGGINADTLHEWYERGTREDAPRGDEDGRYARFAQAVDLAEGEALKRALGAITALFSSENDKVRFEAAKWWLSTRLRDEWGAPKEAVGEPMTPEEADRLIAEAARLAKASGE
jgi:transposase-like protein